MPPNKWIISFSKKAEKSLEKIPKKYLKTILEAIDEMSIDPDLGDVKKMVGTKNIYRKRVGVYRILFEKYKDILFIDIINIADRKDIYKIF